MAYLGREPLSGEVIVLDSIESQFNGSTRTFNLTRLLGTSNVPFYPVSTEQLLVSLGGVIQRPDRTGDTGFFINTNQITFAIAPPAGTKCFIVSFGNILDIGVPANNSVTATKIADGSVTPAKLSTGGPYWDTNGNLGIGTLTPGYKLEVRADNNEIRSTGSSSNYTQYNAVIDSGVSCRIGAYATNWGYIGTTTNHSLRFETNSTTAVTIDSSQKVGIGTSSPQAKLDVNGSTIISATGAGPLNLFKYGTAAPTILMYGANGTDASPTQTLTGDVIGGLNMFGYGPSGWAGGPSVRITAVAAENNGGTINRGADIRFETVVNGGVSHQERMRLTNAGNLGIGTSTPVTKLTVESNFTGYNAPIDIRNSGSSHPYLGVAQTFSSNTGSTVEAIGRIIATSSSWTYATFGSNAFVIESLKPGGINIRSNADAPITFSTGGTPDFSITRVIIDSNGHLTPAADATYDLGSTTNSWRNIYTNDLNLSNEKMESGNDIDGTKGNWTIQEGENDLYIINNKNGKKYRFALEEIA